MSTVAKKVIMGSGAVDAYEIDQSLIFDDGGVASMVRTPSSTGNRKTWTLSVWLKRVDFATGSPNGYQMIYGGQSAYETTIRFVDNKLEVNSWTGTAFEFNWVTTREFRDPSAWFHLVVAFDSTQRTDTNRIKVYIDGEQQTPTTIAYPDQNLDTRMNLASVPQYIGRYHNPAYSYNGYMAEFNWLDGTAAAASSFGETNDDTGQWIPKKYSGSYGTNGFYLKFASGALGTDSSGEGNNYTASNLANSDVVTDSPTNNFATLLPFAGFGTYASNTPTTTAITTSEGNLVGTGASGINGSGSMAVSSGKWYWEVMVIGSSGYGHAGIYGYGSGRISDSSRVDNGNKYRFMLNADDGEWQYATNGGSFSSAAAITGDGGNAVNGPWAASLTCFGTGSKLHFNFGQNGTFNGAATAGGNADSGGVGDFFYAPPSGYLALCTANLPDPAIPLPSAHFNTLLYTGNDADDRTLTGVGFQPDLVWNKTRNATNYHNLFDSVRGVSRALSSNLTAAEVVASDPNNSLVAFTSDGFTVDDSSGYSDLNSSSHTYVTWNWKANGSGSTDTSGDIDAVVSANQAAGFSIVTWTSNGSNTGTVPHGLGVTPEVVLYKSRGGAGNWNFWTTAIDGSNDYLLLNTNAAKGDIAGTYGNLTSSFFPNFGFGNGITMVAYCFASKPSFSKIGIYTGNGNADGPFVNLGFKPAWVLIKKAGSGTASNWRLEDSARSPFNVTNELLQPNSSAAEVSGDSSKDLLSNGFKIRISDTYSNQDGQVFLYMAFAEAPFKTANAR